MPVRNVQGQLAAIVMLWITAPGLALGASPQGATAIEQLNTALAAYHRNDLEGAYSGAAAAASAADFEALDEHSRHTILSLAAEVALKTDRPQQAQRFAARATEMSEESVADWRNRLSAAMRNHDAADEADSLTWIAKNWGRDPSMLPAQTVGRVLGDAREPRFRDARFKLLQTLYELRWRPGAGLSASAEWRDLSLLLLENNDSPRAQQVASLVTDPYDIIVMRADLRYRPLLKSKYFDSDAKRAALRQIETLQAAVSEEPRSLALVNRWSAALARSRRDADAIAAIDHVETVIAQSPGGTKAYDDIDAMYPWILDTKSNALRNLGRFDDAVAALQKAAELSHATDPVSQPVNLAELLCGLNRPDEAAKWIPPLEKASPFGKAQIYLVRLTVALERDDRPEEDRSLTYLREHRTDAPSALEEALLRAGKLPEAQQALLDRLADPTLRSAALAELQTYFERIRPPKAAEWRERTLKLDESPAVRQEVAKIGVIDHYLWRYPAND